MTTRRLYQTELARRFGNNVRAIRQQKGWTLQELGNRIGVGRCRMSEIEHARFAAGLDLIDRIARGLKVPPSRLLE